MKNKWISFTKVKKIAKKFNLKSQFQWYRWAKSSQKPNNVPANVSYVYKNQWISWYDFLNKNPKKFLSYNAARKLLNQLDIKSQRQYYSLNKTKYNLPGHPSEVYKKHWKGWGDFLYTGNTIGCYRKYNVNQKFFTKWSHDMAYVFGLVFADGYIWKKGIIITLHQDDKILLKKIAEKIINSGDLPLFFEPNKRCYTLRINSGNLAKSIIKKLNGKTQKYSRNNLPFVPKKYFADFMRGLWDGDGTIFHNKKGKDYRSSLCSSHLNFLKQIFELLKKRKIVLGGNINKIVQKKGSMVVGNKLKKDSIVYFLRFAPNDTRRLRDFMYSTSSDLKMIRKYKKFMSAGEFCLAPKDKKESYWNFYYAKEYVKNLNLKNIKDWYRFCSSGKKPKNIPSVPQNIYKEWKGYKNWLGRERKYLPLDWKLSTK